MSTHIGYAEVDHLSNDIFFSIYILGENETLRWTGYNDAYWWNKVAPTDQFQILTMVRTGNRYRLNPQSREVTRIEAQQ
jgi:hypothetical protein